MHTERYIFFPVSFQDRDGSGTPPFKSSLPVDCEGDVLTRFANAIPTGSAADIKARGKWANGRWTPESARPLNTGNDDDISFDVRKPSQFGVSRDETHGYLLIKSLLSEEITSCLLKRRALVPAS